LRIFQGSEFSSDCLFVVGSTVNSIRTMCDMEESSRSYRQNLYCAKRAMDFSKMARGKPRNDRNGSQRFEKDMWYEFNQAFCDQKLPHVTRPAMLLTQIVVRLRGDQAEIVLHAFTRFIEFMNG
jgi:hypothetical protein